MIRRQHYEFAQFTLPEEAWLNPQAAWDALTHPVTAQSFLRTVWEMAYAFANTAEPPLPADELQAEVVAAGGKPAVCISLPPPVAATEAWYALLVLDNPFRYFVLEAAAEPGTTFVSSRNPESGAHRLWARGPIVAPAMRNDFLTAVDELMRAQSTQ